MTNNEVNNSEGTSTPLNPVLEWYNEQVRENADKIRAFEVLKGSEIIDPEDKEFSFVLGQNDMYNKLMSSLVAVLIAASQEAAGRPLTPEQFAEPTEA